MDADDRSLSSISLGSSESTNSLGSSVQVGIYGVNCVMTLTQLVWVSSCIATWLACCIGMVMGLFYLFERPIEPNILLIVSFGAIIGGGLPLLGCIIFLLWSYCRRSTGYSSIV